MTQAVVENGGVFANSQAYDSVAAFLNLGGSRMTVPTAMFVDACLTRSVRDPLELVMKYPKETSKWGVFVVVVIDTLAMVLDRRQSSSSVFSFHNLEFPTME